MLKTPSFQYYDDLRVTIYQDDTEFWKFYMLPDRVQLRIGEDGDPVFQLIKFAYSDEAREADDQLSSGGGIMMMDVELRVPENDQGLLRARLQAYVDREWNRLKSLSDAENVPVESLALPSWHNRTTGVPRPAGDPGTPPELKIDDVLLAAQQFEALMKADVFVKMVFNVVKSPDQKDIDRVIDGAVDMFLARYAA